MQRTSSDYKYFYWIGLTVAEVCGLSMTQPFWATDHIVHQHAETCSFSHTSFHTVPILKQEKHIKVQFDDPDTFKWKSTHELLPRSNGTLCCYAIKYIMQKHEHITQLLKCSQNYANLSVNAACRQFCVWRLDGERRSLRWTDMLRRYQVIIQHQAWKKKKKTITKISTCAFKWI